MKPFTVPVDYYSVAKSDSEMIRHDRLTEQLFISVNKIQKIMSVKYYNLYYNTRKIINLYK